MLFRSADIDLRHDDQRGVATGYGNALDELTRCGYPCGQVTGVAAVAKGGKSTFLVGSFMAQRARCVYATFADLNPEQLKRRSLKQLCGLGGEPKVRLDRYADWTDALSQVNDPYGDYSEHLVYDGTSQGRDAETFCGAMLAEHARQPLTIIFADYIQRMSSREITAAKHGRTAIVEHVSQELADLARKLDIPIVIGSQITSAKDGEWMTKYASALMEDVGWLIKLTREDGATEATVEIALNRFGPQKVRLPFVFDENHCKFTSRQA